MEIYGNSMQMTTKALDYLWKKETVLSNNIANVETPGYKSKYVTFQEEFKNKLINATKTGNSSDVLNAINSSNYQVHESKNESTRQDQNNVNADVDLMELTKTSLQYQYLLSSINSDITRFNTVIKGQ